MTDSVLTYRDCYDQCKSLALDIIEEHKDECKEIEDFMDKTWEWVDQHEWVIYYYRAHQFLAAIDGHLRAEAEDTLQDIGSTPESYDDYASQLTYWAINIWVSRFIEESLESATA